MCRDCIDCPCLNYTSKHRSSQLAGFEERLMAPPSRWVWSMHLGVENQRAVSISPWLVGLYRANIGHYTTHLYGDCNKAI